LQRVDDPKKVSDGELRAATRGGLQSGRDATRLKGRWRAVENKVEHSWGVCQRKGGGPRAAHTLHRGPEVGKLENTHVVRVGAVVERAALRADVGKAKVCHRKEVCRERSLLLLVVLEY
jgi:hypothetical protein